MIMNKKKLILIIAIFLVILFSVLIVINKDTNKDSTKTIVKKQYSQETYNTDLNTILNDFISQKDNLSELSLQTKDEYYNLITKTSTELLALKVPKAEKDKHFNLVLVFSYWQYDINNEKFSTADEYLTKIKKYLVVE